MTESNVPSKSVSIRAVQSDNLHDVCPDCRGYGCVRVVEESDYIGLQRENERLRGALEKICEHAPTEEPEFESTGNQDDARDYGCDLMHWSHAQIARAALRGASKTPGDSGG